MKYYFRKWKESDTTDNFFRWCVLRTPYPRFHQKCISAEMTLTVQA